MTDVQHSTTEEQERQCPATTGETPPAASLPSPSDPVAPKKAETPATVQTPSGMVAEDSPLARALAKAAAEADAPLLPRPSLPNADGNENSSATTDTREEAVAASAAPDAERSAPETQASGSGGTPPPGESISFFAAHHDAEPEPELADPPLPVSETAPAASENGQTDEEQIPQEEKPMTLMGHLGELRTRLVRCAIAVAIAFVGCYTFAEQLFEELCRPLVAALPEGSKLIFTALPEAFFVYLQVGFVAALFVASPYIFYQIWAFIAPGLYEEEKRFIIPLAACSAGFFLLGASFCFLVVFPFAFTFFLGFANESIAAMPSLSEYLGFALKLLIAFGLIFEMPLFSFFLSYMGIISADLMRRVRRYAILAIFIIAAILTPPDVMSQLLMATPMVLLYEVSIWVAAACGKRKKSAPQKTDGLQEETTASETTADTEGGQV